MLQVFEAIQQSQDDSLINSIIDEVMEPQLRQVIIEAWRDVADVNRSKHVKKVTDITCIMPSLYSKQSLQQPDDVYRLVETTD